ncbi:unnamed protein product [Laminaria digitata]
MFSLYSQAMGSLIRLSIKFCQYSTPQARGFSNLQVHLYRSMRHLLIFNRCCTQSEDVCSHMAPCSQKHNISRRYSPQGRSFPDSTREHRDSGLRYDRSPSRVQASPP